MKEGARTAACALCGTPCRAPFQAPPAELAPDLDFRPGEPTRSTLSKWVMTCGGCGATAPDLAALGPSARAVVEGEAYRALAGTGAGGAGTGGAGTALAFQRWALLCEAAEERVEAAEATLEAAWAADDLLKAGEPEALRLRRRAAALWGEPATVQEGLRLVDVLRRAREFGAAQARAKGLLERRGLDETDGTVLRYQLGLIAAGDGGRHLLSSALRPPARTPHVSHRQAGPARRGLWQRLTGG